MAMARWCDVWLCAETTFFFVLIPTTGTTSGAIRKSRSRGLLSLFDSPQEQSSFPPAIASLLRELSFLIRSSEAPGSYFLEGSREQNLKYKTH